MSSYPPSMESDRVSVLEREVARLQAREAETDSRFAQILETMTRLSQPILKSETPAEVTPTLTPKSRTVRPATPPDFNGDRAKGLAFLNSCQTYLRLCPKEFPDEQTKIVWAMSYMKTGRAQKWTARVFRWEQQPENTDQTRFLDWYDFCDEFKKEFTPAHSDALAINCLESAAYYQKGRPLDDYIDEFQDLIADSGYSDPKTVVVKFRRGLSAQIQNAVATMASGRPSDASPDEWYNMARTVDQNRAANEAFTSAHRTPVPPLRPSGTPLIRPTPPLTRFGSTRTLPTPGNPAPLSPAATPNCFRCKLPGHFGRDCPTNFDVRMLTTEELEEILQERMAQMDVARTDSPRLPEISPEDQQDFQHDSE